jgi:hypothetical protein
MIIQDAANFHTRNELKLDPWYQRRSVWTPAQKGYLINTLFVKKPIPTIYIRHYLDIELEASIKEIVDGQQRMRAVLGYLADEFSARHPAHTKPVKYSSLTSAQRTDFKMTKLPIGVLVNAGENDVIEIFGRLNSISKTLNAQEKRNAQFSGLLKQFCLEKAAAHVQFWRESEVFTATEISRMIEVQFISDLVYNLINGLSDFSAPKLSNMYSTYENDFPKEVEMNRRMNRVFKIIQSMNIDAIRTTIFSRSPIFFSLFYAIDQTTNVLQNKKLEAALYEIDAIFNDQSGQTKKDKEFVDACTASTQRIKNRKTRHDYIVAKIA